MEFEILLIAGLTLLASIIGTITGFGTSTLMVPVLLLFYPLPQTLLVVGVIHWFGNLWRLFLFRSGMNWKMILGFGIPGILGGYAGASLIFTLSESILSRALGIFLLLYVLFLYFEPEFRLRKSWLSALAGGSLSGFFAGVFGIGGAVRSAFLTAYDLPKYVYIFTGAAIAFHIDSARMIVYFTGDTLLPKPLIWGMLLFIPISFIGAKYGKTIADKVPQSSFRSVISFFLFLVGLKLLFFPS